MATRAQANIDTTYTASEVAAEIQTPIFLPSGKFVPLIQFCKNRKYMLKEFHLIFLKVLLFGQMDNSISSFGVSSYSFDLLCLKKIKRKISVVADKIIAVSTILSKTPGWVSPFRIGNSYDCVTIARFLLSTAEQLNNTLKSCVDLNGCIWNAITSCVSTRKQVEMTELLAKQSYLNPKKIKSTPKYWELHEPIQLNLLEAFKKEEKEENEVAFL